MHMQKHPCNLQSIFYNAVAHETNCHTTTWMLRWVPATVFSLNALQSTDPHSHKSRIIHGNPSGACPACFSLQKEMGGDSLKQVAALLFSSAVSMEPDHIREVQPLIRQSSCAHCRFRLAGKGSSAEQLGAVADSHHFFQWNSWSISKFLHKAAL